MTVTITDDRGTRVPLVPLEWLMPGKGERGRRRARLMRASAYQPQITRREVRRTLAYGLLLVPLVLIAAAAPAFFAFGTSWPWWVRALGIVPGALLPAVMTLFLARRVSTERIAEIYQRAGLCASCGYDLTEVEAEGDGCRVCPECGAAWRQPGAAVNYARG